MLQYLLEVTLCWTLFYAIFFALLRKITFYRVNRWYLLGALVLGLIIPLLKFIDIELHQEEVAQIAPLVYVVKEAPEFIAHTVIEQTTDWHSIITYVLSTIYFIGLSLFLARFIKGLYTIYGLYKNGRKSNRDHHTVVNTNQPHLPFSFLNVVFISDALPLKEDINDILRHELAHVESRHSLDVLLLEIINILFWFHPMIYLYKTAIRQTHEYLADAVVLENTSRKIYGNILLKQSLSGIQVALAHHFFHSHIKKRINMMYQKKSGQSAWLKYSLALPVLIVLFIVFSGYQSQGVYTTEDLLLEWDMQGTLSHSESPVYLYVDQEEVETSLQDCKRTRIMTDGFRDAISNYKLNQNFLIVFDDEIIKRNVTKHLSIEKGILLKELTIFHPDRAKELYGSKGKYGAIELRSPKARDLSQYEKLERLPDFPKFSSFFHETEHKKSPLIYVDDVLLDLPLSKHFSLDQDFKTTGSSWSNPARAKEKYGDEGKNGVLHLYGVSHVDKAKSGNGILSLYEGKTRTFSSPNEREFYKSLFNSLEIITGEEEGLKRYGDIAQGMATVFNVFNSDEGQILRSNDAELRVYRNASLAWHVDYSSPFRGEMAFILRNDNFEEIGREVLAKENDLISIPLDLLGQPEAKFKIAIQEGKYLPLEGSFIKNDGLQTNTDFPPSIISIMRDFGGQNIAPLVYIDDILVEYPYIELQKYIEGYKAEIVTWIKPTIAIKKYGSKGKNGVVKFYGLSPMEKKSSNSPINKVLENQKTDKYDFELIHFDNRLVVKFLSTEDTPIDFSFSRSREESKNTRRHDKHEGGMMMNMFVDEMPHTGFRLFFSSFGSEESIFSKAYRLVGNELISDQLALEQWESGLFSLKNDKGPKSSEDQRKQPTNDKWPDIRSFINETDPTKAPKISIDGDCIDLPLSKHLDNAYVVRADEMTWVGPSDALFEGEKHGLLNLYGIKKLPKSFGHKKLRIYDLGEAGTHFRLLIIRAGNTSLKQGKDFTVDYKEGIVQILNEKYLNQGIPSEIRFKEKENSEGGRLNFNKIGDSYLGQQNNDKIYKVVSDMPRVRYTDNQKESDKELYDFIRRNLVYPSEAYSKKKEAKEFVQFIVEKDGSITNIEALRNVKWGMKEEAVRIIKKMAAELEWISGKNQGEEVRVAYIVPVEFKLTQTHLVPNTPFFRKTKEEKRTNWPPPLYIVDGVEMPKGTKSEDLKNIERFEGFSDEEALKRYGEKGKDGVVLATSKDKSLQGRVVIKESDQITIFEGTPEQLSDVPTMLNSTTTKSKKDPLFIIDDIRYPIGYKTEELDPNDIESITVIKDPKATEEYGADGKNGVLLISTKSNLKEKSLDEYSLKTDTLIIPTGFNDSKSRFNKDPLFVIDGVATAKNTRIKELDPNDIQTIEVIKDEKATELYGEAGKNGVILITTKDGLKKREATKIKVIGSNENKKLDYKDFLHLLVIDETIFLEGYSDIIGPNKNIKKQIVLTSSKQIEPYGQAGKNGVIKLTMKKPRKGIEFIDKNNRMSVKKEDGLSVVSFKTSDGHEVIGKAEKIFITNLNETETNSFGLSGEDLLMSSQMGLSLHPDNIEYDTTVVFDQKTLVETMTIEPSVLIESPTEANATNNDEIDSSIKLKAYAESRSSLNVTFESHNEEDVTIYIRNIVGMLIEKRTITYEDARIGQQFSLSKDVSRILIVTAEQGDRTQTKRVLMP